MGVAMAKKINSEDYILSVLSPEERFNVAFKIAALAAFIINISAQMAQTLQGCKNNMVLEYCLFDNRR